MDKRFVEIIGENIIKIANEWEQLSSEDLKELKDLEATVVFCVYNSWREFAEYRISSDKLSKEIPAYLTECIDVEKATDYLREALKDDYTELSSGKIVKYE